MYGNLCFENAFHSVTTEETCDCPVECNSLSYSFSLVSTPFDSQGMCPSDATKNNRFLMKEFYINDHPPKFVRKLIHFVKNTSVTNIVSSKDLCMRNLQYRAEVIFRLATDTISVTVMSRRLSFFDKLSDFGNDLNVHNLT